MKNRSETSAVLSSPELRWILLMGMANGGHWKDFSSSSLMARSVSSTTVVRQVTMARLVSGRQSGPLLSTASHHSPAWCQRSLALSPRHWISTRGWIFVLEQTIFQTHIAAFLVCDDHMAYSAVAIYIPGKGWHFSPLHGLAYGLESAVVHFNRLPQLGVAAARRLCLSFCAAYFDDELSDIEFIRHSDVSQRGLSLVFRLLGAPPQPQKAFAPASNRHYLGTSVHTGDFCCAGFVRFQPKSATSYKVLTRLKEALDTNYLSRDAAGKLRGDLNWMYSNCAGQIGKFAG